VGTRVVVLPGGKSSPTAAGPAAAVQR